MDRVGNVRTESTVCVCVGGRGVPYLPVELAVVNHGQHAQGLDGGDRAQRQGLATDLDHVHRVVVALHLELWEVSGWVAWMGWIEGVGGRKRTSGWVWLGSSQVWGRRP